MNNNKIISLFGFNLYRLKQFINQNFIGDDEDKILLQMFNGIIKKYPDPSWQKIEKDFLKKIPQNYIESVMIYTILCYKIDNFIDNSNDFIQDLIYLLCYHEVNPTKIVKYAKKFCSNPLYDIIIDAQINHSIKPSHLFAITMDNFDLENMSQKDTQELIEILNRFVAEQCKPLFDNNYSFFNVYTTLNNLISLEYYGVDTFALDTIPLLNNIPSEDMKEEISELFAEIDNSSLSTIDKVHNCLAVAEFYAYEIPTAKTKRKRKRK